MGTNMHTFWNRRKIDKESDAKSAKGIASGSSDAKRRKTILVAFIVTTVLVVTCAMLVALCAQDGDSSPTQDARMERDPTPTYDLFVRIIPKEEAEATEACVCVTNAKGEVVLEKKAVPANESARIACLPPGDYDLWVVSAPVGVDGQLYELPKDPERFTILDDLLEVEVRLDAIPVGETTDEQAEAAAEILSAAGKSDVADRVRAMKEAHAASGSASGGVGTAGNRDDDNSSGDSQKGQNGTLGGQEAAAPDQRPETKPEPEPTPEPEPPKHVCDFVKPITQTKSWLTCNGCGTVFDNPQQWAEHDKAKSATGDFSHGGYTPHSDSEVVDWQCGCGALKSQQ